MSVPRTGEPRISLPRRRKGRRAVAFAAAAAAIGGLLVVTMTAEAGAAVTGLKGLAEAKNRYFGTALTQGNLGDTTLTGVAGAQFDMVTPGNEMKWDTTEPANGSYNFGPGDRIVSFARSHGMRVRGHNLVWHSQLPSWVNGVPSGQVRSVMEAHITTVATHYRDQVYAWDVVNEPFNEDGSLRGDAFTNAMGSGYLADALRTAHAADPNAKLYLNDYNIEGENAKSDGMYRLVQSLKSQGVPIDGVGLESHFILGQVPSTMTATMRRFTALGVEVAVTELDDRIPLPAGAASLARQANDYATVVGDCLAVSGCAGVSQWGVGDADSWIPGTFPGYGAATLYDDNYQPKPAYGATATALGGSASPPPTTTPAPPNGALCRVAATVDAWNTGLTENIVVTNSGNAGISGWVLGFALPPGQTVTGAWNAAITPDSGQVTATNVGYNGSLATGASVSFGFQAEHTGTTSAPAAFTLNGTPCGTG